MRKLILVIALLLIANSYVKAECIGELKHIADSCMSFDRAVEYYQETKELEKLGVDVSMPSKDIKVQIIKQFSSTKGY